MCRFNFVCGLCFECSGCSKSETSRPSANQSETTPSPGNQHAPNACTLLTSAEIEALQGEPLQESKRTAPGDKSLTVSQCFFRLPTLTKSISLQVVRPGKQPGARTARQLWEEMFVPARLQEFEKRAGQESAAPARSRSRRTGFLDRWTGGRSLHFAGRRVCPAEQCGADDEETRIKKSTTLARSVLKRL